MLPTYYLQLETCTLPLSVTGHSIRYLMQPLTDMSLNFQTIWACRHAPIYGTTIAGNHNCFVCNGIRTTFGRWKDSHSN